MTGGFDHLPNSRVEAIRLGAHRYFSGKPCARGHLAPRYVAGPCVKCQREHARRYGGWKARPAPEEYLHRARMIVEERGGSLLSTEYRSAKSTIRVRCGEGHEFGTNYDRVSHGGWCRKCWEQENGAWQLAAKGHSPEALREFARRNHGGDCLATERVPVRTKVPWKCANGEHSVFAASISNVLNSGTWCPACWAERRRPPQPPMPKDKVERIVRGRGGEIVGVDCGWNGGATRLTVRCANGHDWSVTAASLVYAKSWCPECLHVGERIVRAIFEQTFNVPFPKVRADWIHSPKGRRLELDGYSSTLGIAFEYQGPHHDNDPGVRAHDALKRCYCRERGICLIEVDAIRKPHPPENVLGQVQAAFRKAGRAEKPLLPAHEIFANELEQCRILARDRGGRLLSSRYLGHTPLEWKCANPDHPSWRAEPWRIRKGAWCRYCAKSRPLDLNALRTWGRAYGLELLNGAYSGADKVYRWRCDRAGHRIRRMGNARQSLARGLPACTQCARGDRAETGKHARARALGALGAWGQGNGLELLTATYGGAAKAYRWRCERAGHLFERSKGNAKKLLAKGLPACTLCAGTARKVTLEEVRVCVAGRGWTLLSEAYRDVHTPMSFACARKHRFDRTWKAVQQGRGCTEPGCPDQRVFGRWNRVIQQATQ